MMIKVAPSILSADFSRLGEEISLIQQAGADLIHIDVMDGHFVPNITIGPVVIKDIRKVAKLPLDVHLMIENADKFIDDYIRAGSDMITMHIETMDTGLIKKQSEILRKRGIKVGVSLNPATSANKLDNVLSDVDFILLMSVNPGFSGQSFMPEVVPKIAYLRKSFKGDISVDGGINQKTAEIVVKAGANIVVAGTHVFKSDDYHRVIKELKSIKQGMLNIAEY
jgi:ribulose-phosphate 3-epimerase